MEIVVHGHFYQPPREDPWSGAVPEEYGAAPFHDWNGRIAAESYRPNAFARLFEDGRILALRNNFRSLSFDLGPTLAAWLEHGDPATLARMVEGDRHARRLHAGAGNALAHPWVHAILPLCDPLDRATLLAWGVADFRHRFGRPPRGLWLPETAADNATLAALIDHQLAFTVLAPSQARRVRRVRPDGGAEPWQTVDEDRFDTSRPYRFAHPDGSGRSLAVFFYDGPLAQSVAFGPALRSTAAFVEAIEGAARRATEGLVHLAVDGETMGHHHHFGERVLAHALGDELPRRGYRVTNYEAVLARWSARADWHEVELDLGPRGEGTAWSCAHGLGRWTRDCGCRVRGGSSQTWREPLRRALDFLRDAGREFYAREMAAWTGDPWASRLAWCDVLLRPTEASRTRFIERWVAADVGEQERRRIVGLLESQRHSLLMYTSCGWFFDDFSGLETVLVLRHAARMLDLWDELAADGGRAAPRAEFEEILGEIGRDEGRPGLGADVFRRLARPAARQRVVAGARFEVTNALRRFLRAESASPDAVLAALSAPRVGAPAAGAARLDLDLDRDRARELFWVAGLEEAPADGPRGPVAAERRAAWVRVGEALGFARAVLERRLGPPGPPGELAVSPAAAEAADATIGGTP